MSVARVVEILQRLGEADFDGTAALLAPGFVQEYPYAPMAGVPARIEGIDAFLDFVRPGMSAFEPYRFTIDEIYETTDPRTIVAEYRSHSRVLATGRPYANHYIGVFHFDAEGRLGRWREYLNPEVIARALDPSVDA